MRGRIAGRQRLVHILVALGVISGIFWFSSSAPAATAQVPENHTFATPAYEVGNPADNYDFGEPEFDIGTPPTNHNFDAAGSDWLQVGTVQFENGWAILGNGAGGSGTITSSPFSIPTDAQAMTFQRTWLDQTRTNYLFVYVLSGTDYTISTTVQSTSCKCYTDPEVVVIDLTPWRGQSIKLKIVGYNSVGVDRVGEMSVELVNWTVASGVVQRKYDGAIGSYASLEKVWQSNKTTITSAPFVVAADAHSMIYQYRFPTFIRNGNGLDAYVIPAGGAPVKVFSRVCYCTTSWEEAKFDITNWAGQAIQIKLERLSVSDGSIEVARVGAMRIDVPGWALVDGLVREEAGGPSGDYASLYNDSNANTTVVSSPFPIPAGALDLTLRYKLPTYVSHGNIFDVYILSGSSFEVETRVGGDLCYCTRDWTTLSLPVQSFAGQNVKLKIKRWVGSDGPLFIDDVAANFLEMIGPPLVPNPFDWFTEGGGDVLNLVATGDDGDYWTVASLLGGVDWADDTLNCEIADCQTTQYAAVSDPGVYIPQDTGLAKGYILCQTPGCRNHTRLWGLPFRDSTDSIQTVSTEHWPGEGFPFPPSEWTHHVDSFDAGRDDLFWDLWPYEVVRGGWWTKQYDSGCVPQPNGHCAPYDGWVAYLVVDLDPSN